jgi:hypothetical protein
MRLTPPRRARRRMAGLVMPAGRCWRVSHAEFSQQDTERERNKTHRQGHSGARTLDVVTKHLAVALGAALAQALAALAATRHGESCWWTW